MTDQDKSIALLKLIGWHLVVMPKYHGEGKYRLADSAGNWDAGSPSYTAADGVWLDAPNLYDLKNMALAWQVMYDLLNVYPDVPRLWRNSHLWMFPPEQAQRIWLDKLYALSLEGASND